MAAATAPPTDAAPTPAPPEPKPKASKKVVQGRFGPRERRDLHPMARDDWWHGPAKVFALGLLLVALQKAGCLQIPKRQRAQRVVHFPGSVAAPAPTVLLAADVARCKGSAEPGSGGGPSELTGEGQQGCLLLSIMGEIYDVESGRRHYGARGTYRHFAGRDASRAFVTGKFDEAGLVSSLAGLSGSEVSGVVGWRDFFREHETYKRVGVLAGVFYDADGSPTKAQVDAENLARQYEATAEREKRETPSCNSQWTQTYSDVSCDEFSGGVKREWKGVPRLLHKPGEKDPACACAKDAVAAAKDKRMKPYEGCDENAHVCVTTSKDH